MNIYINNRTYEAATGERLIDIARKNHTHIGYFCGGNGICQTCYVKVIKGMDLLSPITEREKALLPDNLIADGIRVACLTTLDKPGTVELLTTVEEVKRMVEQRPQDIVGYQARMGWEALVKIPDTIAMQARRFAEGKFNPLELVTDVIKAAGDAVALTVRTLQYGWGPQDHATTFTREYVGEKGKHETKAETATCPAHARKLPEELKIPEKAPVN
ncbi:(2Fe-2S)-binding protein [Prosthecochloris sp. ZM_2]|uniref:2Fe-2S iron-sulfur cluster-binding protein n=1 Tax=Prosthecochloris sp. ZM_2 TaxID=2045206 RepID=UPI000DF80E1B|nr:2Fe-2S iron-sulfur cluster-binding protein [Prosthecochloris sp. ZM_2]RNA65199.1 (2Fe-2S)-binding protein [Prosthecochloris sp. ZM_2]